MMQLKESEKTTDLRWVTSVKHLHDRVLPCAVQVLIISVWIDCFVLTQNYGMLSMAFISGLFRVTEENCNFINFCMIFIR